MPKEFDQLPYAAASKRSPWSAVPVPCPCGTVAVPLSAAPVHLSVFLSFRLVTRAQFQSLGPDPDGVDCEPWRGVPRHGLPGGPADARVHRLAQDPRLCFLRVPRPAMCAVVCVPSPDALALPCAPVVNGGLGPSIPVALLAPRVCRLSPVADRAVRFPCGTTVALAVLETLSLKDGLLRFIGLVDPQVRRGRSALT